MSFGDRLFYLPTRHVYGRPEDYGLPYESVQFPSSGGVRLHGWFFPALNADDARYPNTKPCAKGTVIHFHGNAGNITGHFENVRWLPAEGWNVFCFDYRGYGQSTGEPTRQGTVDDGLAAIDYVLSRPDVAPNRLVALGQSLGGAVGIVVAARGPAVRGIAVEGTFSRYRLAAAFVCRQNLLMRPLAAPLSHALVSEGLDPIDWVSRIAPRPTLFVCGSGDRIVDYRQTVELHAAAGEPKDLHAIDGGGHTDSMCTPAGQRRFLEFFQTCLGSVGVSPGSVTDSFGP